MKRMVVVFLCTMLLLSTLTACGKRGNGTVTSSPTADVTVTSTPAPTENIMDELTPSATVKPDNTVTPAAK